jgi:hypothetical protein
VGAVAVQIFLSYARIDDELPSNVADGKGFVTSLYQELLYQFRQSGDVETKIWRDTRDIDPADQFDQIIKNAIDASALLLIVLSPNWLSRPYCRQELDCFRDRWRHLGPETLKHRIVLACKRFVDPGKRPSLLQGQSGHEFFDFEGPDRSGMQLEYFQRGQPQDRRYYTSVAALATSLSLRAEQLTKSQELEPTRIESQEDDLKRKRMSEGPTRQPADPNARKVYLAKPASDMREAYSRLVQELSRNGYAVVPDPSFDIPFDASATKFIDQALSEVDVSIHLLGNKSGYAPEPESPGAKSQPIVALQLSRTRARVNDGDGGNADGSRPVFERLIWAPVVIDDQIETESQQEKSANGSAEALAAEKRQPMRVLADFGTFLPSADKVLGGSLSKFVDFVLEHLQHSDAAQIDAGTLDTDSWVYVYHQAEDASYASQIAKAMRLRGVIANLPALEGDAGDLIRLHQKYLAECNAVVLCWAKASEVWARARANELNWKKLGRNAKFAFRGLLACPPPGDSKARFVEVPPLNEIDITVDATKGERPMTEVIEPFVHLARPHA